MLRSDYTVYLVIGFIRKYKAYKVYFKHFVKSFSIFIQYFNI